MKGVYRGTVLLGLLLAAAPNLHAQRLSTGIAGDGWEAFRGVDYIGGDGTLKKKMQGALVITDTSIAFHECQVSGCYEVKGKPPFKGPALIFIPLRRVTEVTSLAQVRDNKVMSSAVFGPDAKEESVAIVYETDKDAEAPVFKTQPAQSSALVAKLNFRRKKMGTVK